MHSQNARFSGLLLALALAVWAAACTTVPETGRKQLNLISPAQEMQLGLTSFEKLKKEAPISKNASLIALVQKVGKRISAVAPLPNAQWEFVVFESKEPNAFCLPGGKVGIYTGILPITKDEAGMATVMGHEIAHAVARHGGARISEALLLETGGAFLGAALSSAEPRTQAAVSSIYGLGTQLGFALPHSREQEAEADQIGLLYMARAGYDPEAAVAFWQRFAEFNRRSGSATPWFLRTHPLDEERVRKIRGWLPQAKQQYRAQ